MDRKQLEKLCKGHDTVCFELSGLGETCMPTQELWESIEALNQPEIIRCKDCNNNADGIINKEGFINSKPNGLCIINNTEWKIFFVETNNSMLLCNGQRVCGSCHFFHQEIYIDKSLSNEKTYKTICHELTHAFLYETQIKEHETFDEEMICEFMAIYGKLIVDITDKF